MILNYAVITACLNSEQTIEKSIKSVLSQQIFPKQYIFVDGGSYDKTKNIINKWEKNIKENKIHFALVNQKSHGGIYEAWNIALTKLSKNIDIVFILNSDDWLTPDCSEFVTRQFQNYRKLEIVCGMERKYKNIKSSNPKLGRNKPFWLFPILMPIVHPACFVRKNVYDKIGSFNCLYKVSGDYDFLYRCYKNKIKIKFYNKILINRLMGGFAESHKVLARKETLRIGKEYSKLFLMPYIAFFIRKLLKR